MPAPAIIYKLVETFEQNLDSYRSNKNETELRREFLDKFFAALGWDVTNEKGYDELGKEVAHEFSVEVAGQQKKADYAFRVGRGDRFEFLVEAKKPSVKIEASQDAAFQIRRYGWSAKLPVNILTDFEHFAVYDCRAKPNYNDAASTGRIMLVHYKEYAERWDEIASVFSPEAVRKGSLAKYAEGLKGKKGTADVDDAFLQEIERWRETLARNIALRNETIDIAGLNYAVQMTIDRIVFLRICEERGIEPENQLLEIAIPTRPAHDGAASPKPDRGSSDSGRAGEGGVYRELCELFKRADTKYNSGLFHFKQERDQGSSPDALTLSLRIDDKVLKDIISNLYYPKSPYAFLYIPADILGQVYERFLGKVIRFTAGHQAKVEEKPEVRKAGGVYYTPTYIVDYIVGNTVGKLLESGERRAVTPADVAKLKIVDPACGSGTFPLGAYQFLLDWHLNWYVNDDPEKWVRQKVLVPILDPLRPSNTSPKPDSSSSGLGEAGRGYRLSTAKKKEILLNNIYGVDIDPQAVEVTKLSLLLKVLENASGQLDLGMERVLPDLGSNIKCGNSLIGFDYFEGQLLPDEAERARVNPFDWKSEFKEVFAKGGFDVVVGNPPYISTLLLEQILSPEIKPYWKKKFRSAAGAFDIYILFIEHGINILKQSGFLSFIVPNKFLAAEYAQEFRKWIFSNTTMVSLLDYSRVKVWPISVYPVVTVLQKTQNREKTTVNVLTASSASPQNVQNIGLVPYSLLEKTPDHIWSFITQSGADILLRILAKYKALEDVAEVYGASTVAEGSEYPKLLVESEIELDSKNYARFIVSGSIFRYSTTWNISPVQFTHKKYIKPYIKLTSPMPARRIGQAKSAKIIICKVALEPRAFLDTKGNFVGAYTTYVFEKETSLAYITGILNSKLMAFLYKRLYDALAMRGGYLRFQPPQLRRLPIRPIDFTNPAEKAQHDKMVALVETMLELHKRLAGASTPQEKAGLERQIQVTDGGIDALVYELYGLTEEEIKIVEG